MIKAILLTAVITSIGWAIGLYFIVKNNKALFQKELDKVKGNG